MHGLFILFASNLVPGNVSINIFEQCSILSLYRTNLIRENQRENKELYIGKYAISIIILLIVKHLKINFTHLRAQLET